MNFTKYEAAGNTYIIAEEDGLELSSKQAITCCHPIYGIGGDGIITWRSDLQSQEYVHVNIYNPDGSLAEKSGNGLRILATFLFNNVFQHSNSLKLNTLSGIVTANQSQTTTQPTGHPWILLEMGKVVAQFKPINRSNSPNFPNLLTLETELGQIKGYPVSIGNPHFVTFTEQLSSTKAKMWGPHIENHSIFANRTNVQFVNVINDKNLSAEIWERGAGYTLSSGSSSCAIAAVAHHLGYCKSNVTISMPGGLLKVKLEDNGTVWLTGPVNKTVEGMFNLK